MAESKNNIITYGLSGKVGNLIVFRSRGGKTIVSQVPRARTGEQSEAQKAHLRRFQEATVYGKTAIADPETKESYKQSAKEGQNAYNVAVADFMKAPDISEIDLSNYAGKKDDTITITVDDNFKVEKVTVDIYNGDGTQVESGEAQSALAGRQWLYTAQADNASLEGDKIIIRAYDVPGNVTERETSPSL